MSPSDETLMAAVQNGNVDRLAELFRRYRDPIYTFLLRRMNGDRGAAEDLLQDTFERVLKYRSSYRSDQKFRSWLYTIARNAMADHQRRSGRMPLADGVVINDLPLSTASAQEVWEKAEQQDQMQLALNRLSPNYREIVDLAWKRKLKYAEIAQILGTSEGNVKVKMHRACKQLQRNYQKISQ